jgi:hypothetical protein
MELSVIDRLTLLNIIPKEGDYTTLKIVRKLQEELSFSEEEHKLLNFHQEEAALFWDEDIKKEVEIGEKATDVIVDAFKKLDKGKQLKMEQMELYERFVKE